VREVEITSEPRLSNAQRHLLWMHSVVNAVNVLLLQVDAVGRMLGETAEARELEDELLAWHADLADPARAVAQLGYTPQVRARILGWLEAKEACLVPQQRVALAGHVENFESVLAVLDERLAELAVRLREPDLRASLAVVELRTRFEAAMRALERNGFGRWRVSFTANDRTPGAYLMDVDLRARNGLSIRMPVAFEDVVRDLAANARKYSAPGTVIRVLLADDERGAIELRVEDEGLGIPEAEIEDVVQFGRRGSNLGGRRQMGGGFGLTKAWMLTRRFGGRLWIRSGPGEGTTVTIRLPPERDGFR
jgi:hypothetical protein